MDFLHNSLPVFSLLILFFLFSQSFQFRKPDRRAGIAGHPKISSRGNGYCSHLRAVRQTGTLELLSEKSPVKGLQPFQDHFFIISSLKGQKRQPIDFRRSEAETQDIV